MSYPSIRHRLVSVAIMLAPISLSFGCGDGSAPSTPSLVIERDTVGDTLVVRTISGSAWGDSAWLVEELRIGEPAGDDDYAFGRIGAMDIGEDGTIYVHDAAMKALRAYDSTGRYLRTIGGQGGGPGEYQNLLGLAALHDGRLLLRDAARVNVYDTNGSPLTAWPVSAGMMLGAKPNTLVADGHGGAYTMVQAGAARAGQTLVLEYVFLHLDSTGTARDTVPMPTWPEMPPPTMRFSPRGLFALRPDGTFATSRSDHYVVDLPTADGRVLRVERPPLAAIALTPGERAEQQEFFDALARRNPTGERVVVPATKPLIRALRVAPDGRLWVQLHTTAVESGEPVDAAPAELRVPDRWVEPEAWDVFEPDGSFLGHLELPPRASLLTMRGDRAWGVILGDGDVPYVVRWRVESAGVNAAP